MRKPWSQRRLVKILIGLLGLALLLVGVGVIWLLLAGWADVRSDLVQERGQDPTLEEKGRALLARTAERHGLAAWRQHRTVQVTATDFWASEDTGWWPQKDQRFQAERLLGTFTSRVELLDGPGRGEVWGIQSWAAYKRQPGSSEPEMLDDEAIEFYLPTLQYFDELPFRLLAAPIVLYAGTGTYRGSEHERVFVTWGTPEPHGEHDQYDVWIDPRSGLIDVVRYTLRDAVDFGGALMRPVMKVFGAGTIHFQDYREIDGVKVPFRQYVTLQAPEKTRFPLEESFFHRIEVQSVHFDAIDASTLVVDPSRGEVGDAKPVTS